MSTEDSRTSKERADEILAHLSQCAGSEYRDFEISPGTSRELLAYIHTLQSTHEPRAVPKCPECGAGPTDECGRSFMPGPCPMEGDALRAAARIETQCELHGEQDPFTADLRTLVAAVRAAQPPAPEPGIITAQHGETGRMWRGPRSCTPDGYHEVSPEAIIQAAARVRDTAHEVPGHANTLAVSREVIGKLALELSRLGITKCEGRE